MLLLYWRVLLNVSNRVHTPRNFQPVTKVSDEKPVEEKKKKKHGRNVSRAQHAFPTFASFSSLYRSHNSVSMVSLLVQGKECVRWGNVHPFKKASLTKHRFIQQGQKSAEAETELWDAGWSISVWALSSMIHQIRSLLQTQISGCAMTSRQLWPVDQFFRETPRLERRTMLPFSDGINV